MPGLARLVLKDWENSPSLWKNYTSGDFKTTKT